jgi:hypothetical protein
MPDARPAFKGCSGRSGARGAGEREQPSAGAGDLSPHAGRSISQTLSRVTSGGGAASRLSVAGLIAGKDARRCEAFSGSWPPSSTFDTLLDIYRQWSGGDAWVRRAYGWVRASGSQAYAAHCRLLLWR